MRCTKRSRSKYRGGSPPFGAGDHELTIVRVCQSARLKRAILEPTSVVRLAVLKCDGFTRARRIPKRALLTEGRHTCSRAPETAWAQVRP